MGLGRESVLAHPPFFFLGARHWGAEGEILENSLEVKEFGSAVQAPPNPWPFLGMPLTSPAPLMERTALPWARPAPQRLPNDSLVGRSGSPGFQPASSSPGCCNSLPSGSVGSSLPHFKQSFLGPTEIFFKAQILSPDFGLKSSSATKWLCGPRQVTSPLLASKILLHERKISPSLLFADIY